MSELNEKVLSDAQMLPRIRPEMKVYQQIYDGQPYWVYKDPMSLRYYRFNREEHFLIEQLSNNITLGELIEKHQKQFNSQNLDGREIAEFIRSLLAKNILVINHPDRDELLYNSAKKIRKKKLIGKFASFLYLKIPIYDPDKHIGKIVDKLSFIWTPAFLIFYLLILILAGTLIVDRWNDFANMFNDDFFTIWNASLLFAAFWITKVIHEFGHGFTCKHYGGEVHEIGFLILVFMPMLYCNITDSWIFRNKLHRVMATAAGILVELFIAAVATIIWYITDRPQFLHALCFNIILTCSITTVMMNANPLMKFDGYYIVMDIMEIPNLRQRASNAITNLWVKYIFGGNPTESPEEHRYKMLFPMYAVFSFCYRLFLTYSITFMLYKMFASVKLELLGKTLMIFSVLSMVLLPVFKGGNMVIRRREALGITNTRLLTLLAIVFAVTGMVMFIPFQQQVTLNFILEPTNIKMIRAEVSGIIALDQNIAQGKWLKNKSLVAELNNPEIINDVKIIKANIEKTRIEREIAKLKNAAELVNQLDRRLVSLNKQLASQNELIEKFKIQTPFEGQILSLDQDIDKIRGAYVPQGTPIMMVADTRTLQAKVLVPEETLSRINGLKEGLQPEAEMMLYGFLDDKFKGKVKSVSVHSEQDFGQYGERLALSNKVGGEVLSEYDSSIGQIKPMEVVYEVTIDIEPGQLNESAIAYMSGKVNIDCGKSTLFKWSKDSLLRLIALDVWL